MHRVVCALASGPVRGLTSCQLACLLLDMDIETTFVNLGRELEAANRHRDEVMCRVRAAIKENESRGRRLPAEQVAQLLGVAPQTVHDARTVQ